MVAMPNLELATEKLERQMTVASNVVIELADALERIGEVIRAAAVELKAIREDKR